MVQLEAIVPRSQALQRGGLGTLLLGLVPPQIRGLDRILLLNMSLFAVLVLGGGVGKSRRIRGLLVVVCRIGNW